MIGDQANMLARLQAALPARWFASDAPVLAGLLNGNAWATSNTYAQITYMVLQIRIATATGVWLDIICADFFGSSVQRFADETDDAFRKRIVANLFVRGPARSNMGKVLELITGRAPLIIEGTSPTDCGGWDAGGVYWDETGAWGWGKPWQCGVTVYRPENALLNVGWMDTNTLGWDAAGGWCDTAPSATTDLALIAAVESTRPLGVTVWMRILDGPLGPDMTYAPLGSLILGTSTIGVTYNPV